MWNHLPHTRLREGQEVLFPITTIVILVIITVIESQDYPHSCGYQQAHNRGRQPTHGAEERPTRNPVCCRVSCLDPWAQNKMDEKKKHGASSHTNLSKIGVGLYVCSLGKQLCPPTTTTISDLDHPTDRGPSGLQSLGSHRGGHGRRHIYYTQTTPVPANALLLSSAIWTVHLKIYIYLAVPSASGDSRLKAMLPKIRCPRTQI